MAERILVTGATGFVGAALLPALRSAGRSATGTGRSPDGDGVVPLDVSDRAQVRRVFNTGPAPDCVVHLAGIAHQPSRGVGPDRYDAVNHGGVVNVLDAALDRGCRQFVFMSTASVYGDMDRPDPVGESAERRPVGAYAISKANAEDACLARIEQGSAITILRPPAIYSASWLLNVRKRAYVPGTRERLLLAVPGRQPTYSLCAIEHVIQVVELAIDGRLPAGAYNIADPQPYSQEEIAEAVGRVDGVRLMLPLPRFLVRAAVAAGGKVLMRRSSTLWNNYWKLMEGLVLDTARVSAAGFAATTDLWRSLQPGSVSR